MQVNYWWYSWLCGNELGRSDLVLDGFLAAGPVRPALGTAFLLLLRHLLLRHLKLLLSFLCLFIEILNLLAHSRIFWNTLEYFGTLWNI